jgi:hypothetical protein
MAGSKNHIDIYPNNILKLTIESFCTPRSASVAGCLDLNINLAACAAFSVGECPSPSARQPSDTQTASERRPLSGVTLSRVFGSKFSLSRIEFLN